MCSADSTISPKEQPALSVTRALLTKVAWVEVGLATWEAVEEAAWDTMELNTAHLITHHHLRRRQHLSRQDTPL